MSPDNSLVGSGLNGWWKFIVGILIGSIAPSLIAWGSMSAKIETNAARIGTKVDVKTFEEYKEGNTRLLQRIETSLERIEEKIDRKVD